ncbi:IS630 family transposase [Patescibacteria group bacterium]|nr:IS630 family transposase [Patescibacteria group bacterium]
MIQIRQLTQEEKQIFKNYYKKSDCLLLKERAHALLLADQNRSVKDIALILMRKGDTICQWLKDFNQRGVSTIFHKYESNTNASKLTLEQRKEIEKTLKSPPSDKGLPKQFWNVPAIKEYIRGEFDVVYESNRSYHYLLKFNGLSFKLPTPFDFKRDKEQINQKLKEIHKELPKYLNSIDWEVLVADEARITWEAEIRRAWLKKNEKTIIKVHRSNEYQNYFGALNLKNKKARTIKLSWQDTEEIIKALEELSMSYPDKKICLIWDNARWHKSKQLREKLKKNNSLKHIHLINFPPYAPDVNPEEHVWKFGKDMLANQTLNSFEETKLLFENSIQDKSFDYKIPEFVLR